MENLCRDNDIAIQEIQTEEDKLFAKEQIANKDFYPWHLYSYEDDVLRNERFVLYKGRKIGLMSCIVLNEETGWDEYNMGTINFIYFGESEEDERAMLEALHVYTKTQIESLHIHKAIFAAIEASPEDIILKRCAQLTHVATLREHHWDSQKEQYCNVCVYDILEDEAM